MQSGFVKKTVLISFSIITIAVIALFLYAYFNSKSTGRTIGEIIVNIFPNRTDVTIDNNPDGGDTAGGDNTNNTDQIGDSSFITSYKSRLVQISKDPISGASFTSNNSVRYIDKATGNVYEYSNETNASDRITLTTIPQLYDSYWINENTFLARYLRDDNETISSFIATIQDAGEEGRIVTEFLPDNITSVSLSDSKTTLFYLRKTNNGFAGVVYNTKTKTSRELFDKNLPAMQTFFAGEKLYSYTNPSNGVNGSVQQISLDTGAFSFVTNEKPGIVGIGLNDTELLFSAYGNTTTSYIYNTNSRALTSQTLAVVPEKCFEREALYCFLPSSIAGNMPDSWYQGEAAYRDNFYEISQDFLAPKTVVYDLYIDTTEDFDVINPLLSNDNEFVLFTNKSDNSLWLLDMKE